MPRTSIINSASDYYLKQLLEPQSKLTYVIPKYQREYSWRKQQWEDLFNDILLEQDSYPHFLGTIIAINGTTDMLDPRLELIDGQQRLTSLSILLAAFYRKLSDYRDEFASQPDGLFSYMALGNMLTVGGNPRLTLQSQGNNDEDYRYLLASAMAGDPETLPPTPKYWASRGIGKAYKYFTTRIDGMLSEDTPVSEQLFHMVERVENAVLVKIEVPDHASAYTLFESLNDRGLDLSPIDLIKNEILARADSDTSLNVDKTYDQWMQVVDAIGPDGVDQERFLRYYYNALNPSGKPASSKNLIRLYETWMSHNGVGNLLGELIKASRIYGMLAGNEQDALGLPQLRKQAVVLRHAGGQPGFMLLMRFALERQKLKLSDEDLATIAGMLVVWFVRRNLTDFPATNMVPTILSPILREIDNAATDVLNGQAVIDVVRRQLFAPANVASDSRFETALRGPIYEDNREMTRFILSAIAEHDMTGETWTDLWRPAAKGNQYYLTIEHIMPKTEHMTKEWVDALGGAEKAEGIRASLVHTLGNLTLSGFNSDLGRMGFIRKRDMKDDAGHYTGYRNGLSINSDVVDKDSWGAGEIRRRTDRLVSAAMRLFAI